MRRSLLGVSLVCFVIGTVCFGVFFAHVAGFIIQMPSIDVEQGLRQVAPIQAWGWCFLGLYVAGFLILFFQPDRAKSADAEPGTAPDRRA